VEIGSGLGRICKALAGEFERVVGLDISPTMVAQAAALVADDRVTFEVVDGRTLAPIADASADFVCTFTVFQHQRSRGLIADYLTECGRVVRPGGVVALQWNNLPPVRYRLETLRWRLRLRRRRDRAATQTAPEFRGTTAPTAWMRSQLDRAGFDVAGTAGEGTLFAWAWGRRR
jgi:SAM-dependent methyltransferase